MKKWYLAWLMIPLLSGCYLEGSEYDCITYNSIKNCTDAVLTVRTNVESSPGAFDSPVLCPGQDMELEPGKTVYIGQTVIGYYPQFSRISGIAVKDAYLSVSAIIDGKETTRTWTSDQGLDFNTRQFFNVDSSSRYVSEEYSPDLDRTLIRVDYVFKVYSSDFR